MSTTLQSTKASAASNKEKALNARAKTLSLINQAQTLLYEAAQTASPLQGWCAEWEAIGDQADASKALWNRVFTAPYPTGHDGL